MDLEERLGKIPSKLRFDPASIPDEIWVSTMLLPGKFDGYQIPAILPDVNCGQWLGKAALAPLYADESTPASAVVELVDRMPQVLLAALANYPRELIGADNGGSPTPEVTRAAKEIGGVALGMALAQPWEVTTTTIPLSSDHPYRGYKVGFHSDNRKHLPLAKRIGGSRRFIPSVGPSTRLAAACLPDLVTVGFRLGFSNEMEPNYDLYRRYLQMFPDEAVCIGIPVSPGQGSLMDTDLCVHDGMMLFADKDCLTAQILGNWTRGELTQKM